MAVSDFVSPRMALPRMACVLLALWISYLAAPGLPRTVGWENGPAENLQAAALFAGGVLALYWRSRSSGARERQFWLIVAPIWFVLCARELSWGAVFMTAQTLSPETGPTFSSSHQLPYKPLVAPLIAALMAAIVWSFIRSRQYLTLQRLWQARSFPLLEIGLFVFAMLVSAEAEGHGVLHAFSSLSHSARQTLEELSELVAYGTLLLAQWRVARGLHISHEDR